MERPAVEFNPEPGSQKGAIPISIDTCYTGDMVEPVGKIDRPEPRWQAVSLALLAVGGIYVAPLPRAFIVGPKWALPRFYRGSCLRRPLWRIARANFPGTAHSGSSSAVSSPWR